MENLTAERWHRIKALLDEALDQPPGERERYLFHACKEDPALYQQVAALLEAGEEAPAFLEGQALSFAQPFLPDLPEEWEYSSFQQYMSEYRELDLCCMQGLIDQIGGNRIQVHIACQMQQLIVVSNMHLFETSLP